MSTQPPIVFLDTETTGLDPRIHQAWEVCWWPEHGPAPTTLRLPHTLEYADPAALKVGSYWDRHGDGPIHPKAVDLLTGDLRGATLVGANPSFDAAFLTKTIGTPVWHYRYIEVCSGAMWLLGWDRPRSLIDTATAFRDMGREIYEADHTAEGDVRAVRDVYRALRALQAGNR